MKQLKGRKGFTLIELVIVIVIIGILAAISVPMYRQYVRKSMAAEGQALVGAVASSEKIWYSEHKAYLEVEETNNSDDLGVNCAGNKYFTKFSVAKGATAGFTVTTKGAGDAADITVTYEQAADNAAGEVKVDGIGGGDK